MAKRFRQQGCFNAANKKCLQTNLEPVASNQRRFVDRLVIELRSIHGSKIPNDQLAVSDVDDAMMAACESVRESNGGIISTPKDGRELIELKSKAAGNTGKVVKSSQHPEVLSFEIIGVGRRSTVSRQSCKVRRETPDTRIRTVFP